MRKLVILIGLVLLVTGSLALVFFSLGWRGLLQKGLAFLGFRRSAALVGFIWCLGHASWILLGHSGIAVTIP